MARRKTPAAIHIMNGTYREDRHGGVPDPAGRPDKPANLNEAAAKYWDDTVKRIEKAGTLAETDSVCIALLCGLLAEYDMAMDEYYAGGKPNFTQDIVGKGGETVCTQQTPYVSILKNLRTQIRQFEMAFGLTPESRTGLHVQKKTGGSVASRKRA